MKTPLAALKLHAVAITLAVTSIFASVVQAEPIYGIGGTGETATSPVLFTFDSLAPNTINMIGAVTGITAGQSLQGLVFSPGGSLYVLGYDASTGDSQLYIINQSTGAAAPVNATPTNIGNVTGGAATFSFGLAFTPSGSAIQLIDAAGDLFQLDPANGALLPGGSVIDYSTAPDNTPQFVGLAYRADGTLLTIDQTNNLVGAQNAGDPSMLDTVGPLGITLLGPQTIGFDRGQTGIQYLQGDTGDAGVQDELYTVNPANGTATLVGNIGTDANFNTIAIAVVPEPSTYALLAIGVVSGAVWLRRNRRARSA